MINLPGDAALASCDTDACFVTPPCTTTVCSSPVRLYAIGSWVIDLSAIYYSYVYVNAPYRVDVPKVDIIETSTIPVIVYTGVIAVICVGLTILKLAALVPPILTFVMLTKLVPVMVMLVPPANGPVVGDMEYNVGMVDDGKNW